MSSGIVLLLLLLISSTSDANFAFCDFSNSGGCVTKSGQPLYCNNIRTDKATFLDIKRTYNFKGIRTANFKNFVFFNVIQKFEVSPYAVRFNGIFSFQNGQSKSTVSSIPSTTSRININEKGIQTHPTSQRSWCAQPSRANIIENERKHKRNRLCCRPC